jgi:hypothetical protein
MNDTNEPNETTQPGFRIIGDAAPLFEALAKAQAEFQPITKNRQVKVRPRKRDDGYQPPEYTFDYATLDEVQDKTRPALNKYGLSMMQPFFDDDTGHRCLRTILAHSAGSRIEVDVAMPQTRDIQDTGKAITYIKRYQWAAMLGVNSEEDDDGNAADGNTVAESRDRSKAPTGKAAPKPASPPKEPPKAQEDPKPRDTDTKPMGQAPVNGRERELIKADIKRIMAELKMPNTELIVMCRDTFGKAPVDITDEEAGELLGKLTALRDAEQAGPQ